MSVNFGTNVGNIRGNADSGRVSENTGLFGSHSVRIGNEAVVDASELSGLSNIPQKALRQRQVSVVHP